MADAVVAPGISRNLVGRRITTVELKINYFLPVTGGRIFARSHLLRIGSTLCVGNVDLTDEHGACDCNGHRYLYVLQSSCCSDVGPRTPGLRPRSECSSYHASLTQEVVVPAAAIV